MDLIRDNEYGAYETYLAHVLAEGQVKKDRTGTGTFSTFGYQMRFNLLNGFPLITTKKLHTKSIFHELLWFLRGDTNIQYLKDNGVSIWDEWADENGDLGPVYGSQWRSWPGKVIGLKNVDPISRDSKTMQFQGEPVHETIDQIAKVVESLKNNPDSRRHIVSAWNPAQVDDMALPPCHALFQFYVSDMTNGERLHFYKRGQALGTLPHISDEVRYKSDNSLEESLTRNGIPSKKLSCQLYQRSADSFLGVPYNIASYALLTEMVAQQCGYAAGDFVWTGGDCHIYSNHFEQTKLQLSRMVVQPVLYELRYPTLKLNKAVDIFSYKYEDIEIIGYNPAPAIPAPIAV